MAEKGERTGNGRQMSHSATFKLDDMAATARGEPMSRKEANVIDKALASGLHDSHGGLNFVANGTREEIIGEIMDRSAAWDSPMSREQAEMKADAAIRAIWERRVASWIPWAVGFVAFLLIFSAVHAEPCHCQTPQERNQVHRGDIYRHGEPENGGYRGGFYNDRYWADPALVIHYSPAENLEHIDVALIDRA